MKRITILRNKSSSQHGYVTNETRETSIFWGVRKYRNIDPFLMNGLCQVTSLVYDIDILILTYSLFKRKFDIINWKFFALKRYFIIKIVSFNHNGKNVKHHLHLLLKMIILLSRSNVYRGAFKIGVLHRPNISPQD